MSKTYKDLLSNLGYDTKLEGVDYFLDVAEYTSQVLESFEDEDKAREMIPCCCLEYAHFYYEVGLIRFNRELDRFVKSRKIRGYNRELNTQVYGNCGYSSTDDMIIKFARYMNSKKENIIVKPLVKCSNG